MSCVLFLTTLTLVLRDRMHRSLQLCTYFVIHFMLVLKCALSTERTFKLFVTSNISLYSIFNCSYKSVCYMALRHYVYDYYTWYDKTIKLYVIDRHISELGTNIAEHRHYMMWLFALKLLQTTFMCFCSVSSWW